MWAARQGSTSVTCVRAQITGRLYRRSVTYKETLTWSQKSLAGNFYLIMQRCLYVLIFLSPPKASRQAHHPKRGRDIGLNNGPVACSEYPVAIQFLNHLGRNLDSRLPSLDLIWLRNHTSLDVQHAFHRASLLSSPATLSCST